MGRSQEGGPIPLRVLGKVAGVGSRDCLAPPPSLCMDRTHGGQVYGDMMDTFTGFEDTP
jgi:hypothetical protein